MLVRRFGVLLLLSSFSALPQDVVTIRVDANAKLGPFKPISSYFGYDEPNYTYADNGRKLISELANLSYAPVYIRAHNLLTTGDGTPALKWGSTNAYTEDAAGKPVYSWTIVDKILDTYLHANAKPFVELGFMPEALSTKPEPYQHSWPKTRIAAGWAHPPKDYAKWSELARQLVLHSIQRYGEREVNSWYFEVWNEPDIEYWQGTPEEYMKLYDAVDDDAEGPDAPVKLTIAGAPAAARRVLLRHYRIDRDHSNAYTVWKAMSSPQQPTPEQHARLEQAGQLELLESPKWISSNSGKVDLEFSLPRQGVSLLQLSW